MNYINNLNLLTCLFGDVFAGVPDGHFSDTEGVLTTRGWGRSDSDIAGDILDCSGAISPPVVPVIGPHRGSKIHVSYSVIFSFMTGNIN